MKTNVVRKLVSWSYYPAMLVLIGVVAGLGWAAQSKERIPEQMLLLLLTVAGAAGGVLVLAAACESLSRETTSRPLPETTPKAAVPALPGGGLAREPERELAEMAMLAWRIHRGAESAPGPSQLMLQLASRLLEVLKGCEVEIVSWADKTVEAGNRVEILERVEGEQDRVVAEYEPEVRVHGRLVRKAVVSVGKGGPSPNSSC
jgi:hypothetical protein